MSDEISMIPVLQFAEENDLRQASEHLTGLGFQNRYGPFGDLPEEMYTDWMTPADEGYICYLPENEKFEEAMDALGKFFGYTG